MNSYIYCADIYCEECGEAIRAELDKAGKSPRSPDDESTYDSDDYPKGPFQDGGGEADSPQHCGAGESCLNAIIYRHKGRRYKVGCWLENPLTSAGVEYVREAIATRPRGAVAARWALWYAEELSNG